MWRGRIKEKHEIKKVEHNRLRKWEYILYAYDYVQLLEKEEWILLEQKTYKSYKELCKAMNWSITGGNTKVKYLKELDSLCKWH